LQCLGVGKTIFWAGWLIPLAHVQCWVLSLFFIEMFAFVSETWTDHRKAWEPQRNI
jgi:hypothetical protein